MVLRIPIFFTDIPLVYLAVKLNNCCSFGLSIREINKNSNIVRKWISFLIVPIGLLDNRLRLVQIMNYFQNVLRRKGMRSNTIPALVISVICTHSLSCLLHLHNH